MRRERNLAKWATIVTAALGLGTSHLLWSQGLPPVCDGSPPTPVHRCRLADGTCSTNDACAGNALGQIWEPSRTSCCYQLGGLCYEHKGYWRCCRGDDKPATWKAVCKLVKTTPGACMNGETCSP